MCEIKPELHPEFMLAQFWKSTLGVLLAEMALTVCRVCSVQASSAAVPPGAAEGAGSAVVRLHEEHHAQPAETGPASHQGHFPWPAGAAGCCHGAFGAQAEL